jgi:menaquinone-specific isochorismate synthase
MDLTRLKSYISDTLRALDGQTAPVFRIEIEIPAWDPLLWLYHNPHLEKTWWKSKDSPSYRAGLGIADCITNAYPAPFSEPLATLSRQLSGCKDAAYIGGFRFPSQHLPQDEWRKFGYYRFILPLFELSRREDKTFFSCHFVPKNHLSFEQHYGMICDQLDALSMDFKAVQPLTGLIQDRCNEPEHEDWRRHVESLRSAIYAGHYQKVVLARKTSFSLENPVDPAQLLWFYNEQGFADHHTQFIMQVSPHQSFVGATPEWLYHREGKAIVSEALAGTRSASQKEELLHSAKDRDEHLWVSRMISDTFSQLCESFHPENELARLDLAALSHLYVKFKGTLKEGVTDADILNVLYPTPAVSGFPVKESLAALSLLEPFDRGWYAGAVGCIQADSVSFAVAIRSALIDTGYISFFSGAGITADSEWDVEWDELEAKLAPFFSLFGYEHRHV